MCWQSLLPKSGQFISCTIKKPFQLPRMDDIWVRLPSLDGVPDASGQNFCLIKSLYGIRQAATLWYELFSNTITKIGFRLSPYIYCLLIKEESKPVCTVIYVDELLLFGISSHG